MKRLFVLFFYMFNNLAVGYARFFRNQDRRNDLMQMRSRILNSKLYDKQFAFYNIFCRACFPFTRCKLTTADLCKQEPQIYFPQAWAKNIPTCNSCPDAWVCLVGCGLFAGRMMGRWSDDHCDFLWFKFVYNQGALI